MFIDLDDSYHMFTFIIDGKKLGCYVDNGLYYKETTLNSIAGNEIVGIRLANTTNQTLNLPCRKVIFYNEIQTEEQVINNYNRMIKETITTGYENLPFETKTIFANVNEMVHANLKEGSIVSTLGYRTENDNGQATYEIVTYDTFFDSLPIDCRTVQKIGQTKTTVDQCGNHKMKNGLIAMLKTNGTTTPEQWGCHGDGIHSDTESLICLFALFKTGTINFKDGAVYMVATRSADEYSQYAENRFCYSMIKTFSGGCHRPLIANCNNLVLDGNPAGDGNLATMKNPDNDFGFGMAMLDLGGHIDGLEIKNLILDANGLTIEDISVNGVANKTSNHTICYNPGVDRDELPIKMGICNNLNIHHNKFLSNGTLVDISDGGGDHIILINPTESKNVFIEDNYFEDCGRWVFSVDLGGNGERFYNYKFNRNRCIQTDKNKLSTGAYRGLGWIDFEARKCWTDLEVNGNYVEGLVGFAMNGNGKVLENYSFCDNEIHYIARTYRSAYPYFINFYSVSCAKNSVINNNIIDQPYNITPSGCIYNLEAKNNTLSKGAVFGLNKLYGDITFDNNIGESDSYKLFSIGPTMVNAKNKQDIYPPMVDAETMPFELNLTLTNNTGYWASVYGISGFTNPNFPGLFEDINITIANNKMSSITFIAMENKTFDFDYKSNMTVSTGISNFVVKGAHFTGETVHNPINSPVMGGGMWTAGQKIASNVKMNRMELCKSVYTDQIIAGKTYDLYCTQDGYFPQGYVDTYITTELSTSYGQFYYTDTDLYQCKVAGKTSTDVSNLTEVDVDSSNGAEIINGTTTFVWVAKIGKLRADLVS